MIRTWVRLLVACTALGLWATHAVPAAEADIRSVYTVKGIPVDETAPSVIEAQRQALAAARLEGSRRFIQKITLFEDRQANGGLFIDQTVAETLTAAVDVEEETRGGGRYVGVMSVVLNPRTVRAFLDERGVPYLDRQAPLALMVPVGGGEAVTDWQASWPEADPGALAQYITAAGLFYGPRSTWTDLKPEIDAASAKRAIMAQLLGEEGAYRVRLSLITPQGQRALGTTNPVLTLEEAVTASTAYLGEIWKREAIIRSDVKSLASASILYTSIAEWNALRGALIRSPLVSDFQTLAIARDGAMVRFAFAGEDVTRLQSELRQRGVALDPDPSGWVLTSSTVGAP
ncbi:MAG: hypothetical protein AAGJ32_05435 [Pseudomonadota bacterium]